MHGVPQSWLRKGSPPQVRGKRRRKSENNDADRITPAGAGKTCAEENTDTGGQDHPRRCGENKEAQAIKVLRTGSPPQVRGKHAWELPIFVSDRITPAGAGKTL